MKKMLVVALAVVAVGICWSGNARADVNHRFGVGVNYYHTLDDFDIDHFDNNGLSYYLSYQLRPATLMKFELDLEMMPDNYGGSPETVYAPQGYLIVGGTIYAGLGVGTYYTDGDFSSDPFYALRAGLDLHLLPFVWLDIYGIYRFDDWNDISNVDEDLSTHTIMLGGAARIEF